MYKNRQKIISFVLITIFGFIFAFLPTSEAHILVVGDSNNYDEASKISSSLKSNGYQVLDLYKENATAKNIVKGMYGADAVIYAGHGGYQTGNYDMNGGTATPPYALVGSDKFIWGIGDQMREGLDGKLFTAPFKQNIPVILLHTCFSTAWVETKEVANPTQTIYNFARMFTGAGANYYATGYSGERIIGSFLNGAANFEAADNSLYENIVKSTEYNGTQIWRNDHGWASFVGDWSAKFPTVTETTAYDDTAAETWYNSDRTRNVLISRFTISNSPYYVNQTLTFTDSSSDVGGHITNYFWDFGDGSTSNQANPIHTFNSKGTYTITHTVIDNNTKTSTSDKTITVTEQSTVITQPPAPSNPPVITAPPKPNYTYKYLKKYKYKGKWRYKVVYVRIQKYLKKYKYRGKWRYKWVTKKISWS
ncbi:PKD domain-containing protein [Methanobacterium sp. ACI-7]|uniref:PKD domain-containing protein n=1 Tax=unclassified Methanobacterium TaxID=2627676 RepID=UPI0039C03AD5